MTFKLVLTLALLTLGANGFVLKNKLDTTDKTAATIIYDSTESPTTTTEGPISTDESVSSATDEEPETTSTKQSVTDITFSSTTTGFLPYKPCAGRLILVLDTGKTLSNRQFKYQQQFIGHKLFSSNFTYFDRLSVSQYSGFAQIEEFGYFENAEDVAEYVDSAQQSNTRNANLRRALSAILNALSNERTYHQTTVSILVSHFTKGEVDSCRELVEELQEQDVRVVLVAHGTKLDTNLLAKVTGDHQLVFEWYASAKEPVDQQNWLRDLFACPV